MRGAIWAGVVVLLMLAGAWSYAKYDIMERHHDFIKRVEALGTTRGGHLPEVEDIEADVEEIAEELGLQLDELEATIEPVGDDNMDRAGPMANMVQGEVASKGL